jgi:hypothetical protein
MFKDLVEIFKKRPLGKPRCKGGILLKDIYIKRDIFVFSVFALFLLVIKIKVTKNQYMEQPRSSKHSKREILFLHEFFGKLNIRTVMSSEVM